MDKERLVIGYLKVFFLQADGSSFSGPESCPVWVSAFYHGNFVRVESL